jgi:hypothetical protein
LGERRRRGAAAGSFGAVPAGPRRRRPAAAAADAAAAAPPARPSTPPPHAPLAPPQVYGLPALMVFRDGRLVEGSHREGAISKAQLQKYLQEHVLEVVEA